MFKSKQIQKKLKIILNKLNVKIIIILYAFMLFKLIYIYFAKNNS